MALYMPTNVMPSTLGTFGGGIVDALSPLVVSWQVDGGSPMTAYQIDILQNTASSVLLYSTGRITENCPFYGRDETGKVVLFSHTVTTDELRASDIRNGGTYKLLVTQWWSEADSVTQQSASVFMCRETPVLTVTDFQESVNTKKKTWNAKCVLPDAALPASILWVRWELAVSGEEETPLKDTGEICTPQLTFTYDGLFNGTDYALRCTVQTATGQRATTGWKPFSVAYNVTPDEGTATVCVLRKKSGVLVSWTPKTSDGSVTSWAVYRAEKGTKIFRHIANLPNEQRSVIDCTAVSGATYVYYIYGSAGDAYSKQPIITGEVSVCLWDWTILSCKERADGSFLAEDIFRFSLNVASGNVNNGNKPNVANNFTRYPTVQMSPTNYMSGTLSGYIGSVGDDHEYHDTKRDRDGLFALSTTKNALFLKNRKGDLARIRISGNVSVNTQDATKAQAQIAAVPWVESGSGAEAQIYLTKNDALW